MEWLVLILIVALNLQSADFADTEKTDSDLRQYNTLKCIDQKQGSWSSSILHQYAGCHKQKISQTTRREFRAYRYERDSYLGKN